MIGVWGTECGEGVGGVFGGGLVCMLFWREEGNRCTGVTLFCQPFGRAK